MRLAEAKGAESLRVALRGFLATVENESDLIAAVSEHARSEDEVIATVVYMVNSGTVRLAGNFRGARFDLGTVEAPTPRAA